MSKTTLSSNFTCLPMLPGNYNYSIKDNYSKDQLFHFKNSTCLEKPNFSNLRFSSCVTSKDKEDINALSKNLKDSVKNESQELSLSKKLSSSTDRSYKINQSSASLRTSFINQSYPKILPQWIKLDRQVLKFICYFNEAINESNVENFRIRTCTIYYYLEDDTIQVVEHKSENSGLPQGTLIKRHKIEKQPGCYYTYNDIDIGSSICLYSKLFRVCDCDEFTRKYYANHLNKDLGRPEEIPEYISQAELIKQSTVNDEENLKNITEIKDYCEVKLGGGKGKSSLLQFLANDRKVLAFDIIWIDDQEMEEKHYKMHYYLADNQVEIREIKMSNSGKDNYPNLLSKGKLPKKADFVYCPGLGKRNNEIYMPEDLLIGNHIDIYGRKCFIYGCDDFTKSWYKEKFGIDMIPIKTKKALPRKIEFSIPPYNGFGSEEDSLLNVYHLKPSQSIKKFVENFKGDRHVLRFKAKLITQYETEQERRFIMSYFVGDNTMQIYEVAPKNSGREACKFIERQKVINPLTNQSYNEKDIIVGASVYVNKFIFKLTEKDKKTTNYMKDNCDVFADSSIIKIIRRIQGESGRYNSADDFMVELLRNIDPLGKHYVQKQSIVNGLKKFDLHLSPEEETTLFEFLDGIRNDNDDYCMEDFFELIKGL